MSQVRTVFTSDDRDVQKALERLQRETVKLREQNQKLRRTTQDLSNESKAMFGGMQSGIDATITKWATFGGVMAGAMKTIQLLRSEYDNLIERQQTAADRQITLAAAQRQAIFNLGSDQEFTPRKLVDEIARVAERAGVSQLTATNAVSDALSARGDRTARQAIQAVSAALTLAPDQPENLPILSGAALDIGKATNLSPEQSLGLLMSIGRQARVTNLQGLTQNVAPALLGVQAAGGDTVAEAGALVATATQGMVDTEGRKSRTFAIALAQQLRERLPEMGSTMERIRAAQQDPELAKRILEGGQFQVGGEAVKFPAVSVETQARPTLQKLLAGGQDQLAQSLESSLAELQGADFGGTFSDTLKTIGELPAIRVAQLQRAFDAAEDQLRVSDTAAARSAVLRQGLERVQQAAGKSRIGTVIGGAIDDLASGGELGFQDAASRLSRAQFGLRGNERRVLEMLEDRIRQEQARFEGERRQQREPRRVPLGPDVAGGNVRFGDVEVPSGEVPNLAITPGMRENAARTIDAQTQMFNRMLEISKQQLKEQQKTNEKLDASQRNTAAGKALQLQGER